MGVKLVSASAGSVELVAPATASNYTATMPAATGNVVLDSATQTLTNKTIQGGAITSGTAVASTSGTSIDFTGIPSWVKRITVMFKGVSTSSTANIQIQLGTGAGPTFTTSGYVSGSSTSSGTTTTVSTGLVVVNSVGASEVYSGSVSLINITGTDWTSSGVVCNTGTGNTRISGGYLALGATLTAVRITTTSTDTFDAGTINILYE